MASLIVIAAGAIWALLEYDRPNHPDAAARLGQQLLDVLTAARWDDGTLLVDVDRSVLTTRVLGPLLRGLRQLEELPCLFEHQQLGSWEPAGDDPELVCRHCFACGGDQIAPADALAPNRRCPGHPTPTSGPAEDRTDRRTP